MSLRLAMSVVRLKFVLRRSREGIETGFETGWPQVGQAFVLGIEIQL